jgi:hypothetical protein
MMLMRRTAEGLLGRGGRVVHRHFLRGTRIRYEVRELPSDSTLPTRTTVELQARVGLLAPVDHERGVLQVVGAAHVLQRAASRAGWRRGRE